MDRRGPARVILALATGTVAMGAFVFPGTVDAVAAAPFVVASTSVVSASAASASVARAAPTAPAGTTPDGSTPDDTVPERPPATVSEFYPEDNNLTDCVGLVEQPGCGSDARGGSGQTAVFVAVMAGFGVIVWRIVVGLRRNRTSR